MGKLIVTPLMLILEMVVPVFAQQGETVETRIDMLNFKHDVVNGYPAKEINEKLYDELYFQRACEVYLWVLGPVSFMEWPREAQQKFAIGNLDLVLLAWFRSSDIREES